MADETYTEEQRSELTKRMGEYERTGFPEKSAKIRAQMAADTPFEELYGSEADRQEEIDELPAPPRGGPGSGVEAWRNFAKQVTDWEDVDDMDRDEIILALEEDGLIEPNDPEGNG